MGGRTLEGRPDPPPRFCHVSETVTAVHGRVHPPHHLPPVQVPPGVPGHAGGLSRCESVGYCYPTASQRDAPPRDGDPPRCGRAWPGTVHPVCTRRLTVAHADRGAGECNGADEQCSGDALRASESGRGGSGHRGQFELQPLDQGYEESAPAEAVPATNLVPAPQEEDMPEAPADAEDMPAAPADADAAPPPPPPQSAAE